MKALKVGRLKDPGTIASIETGRGSARRDPLPVEFYFRLFHGLNQVFEPVAPLLKVFEHVEGGAGW